MALEDIYDYIIKVTMALQIITGTSTKQSFWKKNPNQQQKKNQLGINGQVGGERKKKARKKNKGWHGATVYVYAVGAGYF